DDFLGAGGIAKTHGGRVGLQVAKGHLPHAELDGTARIDARLQKVLDHFVLGVNGDRAAPGELGDVDAPRDSGKAYVDPSMDRALSRKALMEHDLSKKVDRALLQHAGANRCLDLFARARLEDYRLDAGARQQ